MFKHSHTTSTEVATRTSKRRYTHVLRGSDRSTSAPFEDRVISWHGSEAAAVRAAKTASRWACDLRIEPVERVREEA